MSSIDTGGPAFPSQEMNHDGTPYHLNQGMGLRDYFAAHAPEPPATWRGGSRSLDDMIAWRWWYADAMLKARSHVQA